MFPERMKLKLLWLGAIASVFINIVFAHGFGVAMMVSTLGHYSEDTKLTMAGFCIVGIAASLVMFYACSYKLFRVYSAKERKGEKLESVEELFSRTPSRTL